MKNTMNKTGAIAGGIASGDANAVNAGFNGASNAVEWNFMQEYFRYLGSDLPGAKEERQKIHEANEKAEEINEDVKDGIKTGAKVGYAAGVEMLPPGRVSFGDIVRLGFGRNPYTGQKLSDEQKAQEWLEWLTKPHISNSISKVSKIDTDVYGIYQDVRSVNEGYQDLNEEKR